MRTDVEARQQIIEIAEDLFAMGHLTATGGNISAKGADPDTLWSSVLRRQGGDLALVSYCGPDPSRN